MPIKRDYVNAAKKLPSNRSTEEQALVDKGSNMQEVRNADFEARRTEKRGG
jgi:hypothetical protein